ncbi:MAG: twin-arginine translocation pathway signal protein [Pseudomonadota bacterium]
MVSRRMVLMAGGAAAVVTGAGLVGYARGPGQGRAVAPWTAAGEDFGDARLNALAYAILAPNSHNRQPWEFELEGEDTIHVYCDLNRRLPETDPQDRQIVVSFGCMLELLSIAAAEAGYRADVTSFPDGYPAPRIDGRRLASVRFVAGEGSPDPLFGAITRRRSNKQAYDLDRPVSGDALAALTAPFDGLIQAGGTNDPARVEGFKALAKGGFVTEFTTDRTRRESIDVMRIGNRAINENPDGLEMGGIPMGLMNMAGLVTPETLDTPGTVAFQSGLDMYDTLIDATPAFVWLASTDGSRALQVEAGRAWVRLNLMAEQMGLSVHPLSQVLQEFPEMSDAYGQVHADLGVAEPGVVQMFARVGYGPPSPATPRWPLAAKLLPAAV